MLPGSSQAHGSSSKGVRYIHLYSLAFMDHPCTLCAAVCHEAPPCLFYSPGQIEYKLDLKIFSTQVGVEPMTNLTTKPPMYWDSFLQFSIKTYVGGTH